MWRRQLINRFLIRPIAIGLLRVEIEGQENIPSGPFILMANHVNWLDPVVAGLAIYPRDAMFMIKIENAQHPYLRYFFYAYDAVPIDRGEADTTALRRAVEVLTVDRDILYVAPEGTRSGDGRLLEAKNGMTFVAMRAGVPILPVGITGVMAFGDNLRRRRRTPVRARVGYPFRLRAPARGAGQRRARKETLTVMTREAMHQLAALLPPEQRGAYADVARATEEHLEFLELGRSNLKFVEHPQARSGGVVRLSLVGVRR
jgi:1-acyl-sn-glycerol-3-phosphate acyltransferase